MELSVYTVAAYNIVNIIAIVVFGTRLIIKFYEDMIEEKIIKDLKNDEGKKTTYNVFLSRMNQVRKRFWFNFVLLELSLLAYFIFWGLLFYNGAVIIY